MSRKLETGNMALLNRAAKRAGSMFGVDETRSYREVDVAALQPDPNQPRKNFDQAALQELADSFADVGVLQPLVVQERSAGQYTIVAGERRWRAAQLASLSVLPVIVVREDVDPQIVAIIENLQRRDLDAIEEARALARLGAGSSQEALGKMIGKSQVYIARSLALLHLPQEILDTYHRYPEVSASALRTIADVRDEERQLKMWAAALEGATIRQLEAMKANSQATSSGRGKSNSTPSFSKLISNFAASATKKVSALRDQKIAGAALSASDRAQLEATKKEIDDLLA